jgi:molybdate transport repressor ModE-like protein
VHAQTYATLLNDASANIAQVLFMTERSLSWDDARFVLAVHRAGSLTAAAVQLGVSHPTVFRRIRDLEASFGVQLFERSRAGYVATGAGEALAEAAVAVEERFVALERHLRGADLRPAGVVRVTTNDTLLASFLPEVLRELRRRCPAITLEVTTTSARLDLSRREADIALRPGGAPPEEVIGRRLGDIASAVYAPAKLAAPRDLGAASWIAPDDSLSHLASYRWIAAGGLAERVVLRTNSLLNICHAIRAGLGVGILPCYLGDAMKGVRRVRAPIPELASAFWLLVHPDLRRVPRIRTVLDELPKLVQPYRALLAGRGTPSSHR